MMVFSTLRRASGVSAAGAAPGSLTMSRKSVAPSVSGTWGTPSRARSELITSSSVAGWSAAVGSGASAMRSTPGIVAASVGFQPGQPVRNLSGFHLRCARGDGRWFRAGWFGTQLAQPIGRHLPGRQRAGRDRRGCGLGFGRRLNRILGDLPTTRAPAAPGRGTRAPRTPPRLHPRRSHGLRLEAQTAPARALRVFAERRVLSDGICCQ